MKIREGALFADRYRIGRRLAKGGMGEVYRAVEEATKRPCAVKVMLPHIVPSRSCRRRFEREARVATLVQSEFIIDVFDAGVDDATSMPFMVMELLEGEDLGDRVRRLGRLPPTEVVSHLEQVAAALDRTHAADIIHRDLKPENLFLAQRPGAAPCIKVLDFGIAKILAEVSVADSLGPFIGTPVYMSPEQLDSRSEPTHLLDVYALGIIAYTLLVGREYWAPEAARDNIIHLVGALVQGTIEPASRRAMAAGVLLPTAFDGWFATVTALDPARRFPNATSAVVALKEALGPSLEELADTLLPQTGIGRGTPSRPPADDQPTLVMPALPR